MASFLLGPELLAYDRGVVAEPVLWQYNFSNFNEKVRWALDYKGVAHVRHSLLPNAPRAVLFSVRGKLPVLDLDGQRIVDSTRIIEALERRYPEPALYPVEVDERRRAVELEDFFDEHVGHEVRRALFYEQRDNLDYVGALLTTGRGAMTRRVYRALMSLPGSTSYQRRRYRFYGPDAERARRDVAAGLDRIVTELGPSGYLVGSRFTVADLTAGALLYPLAWPAELQYDYPEPPPSQLTESLCEHPGVDWIREIYRRHRGSSAAITG
jgi:glutathione S-transferase